MGVYGFVIGAILIIAGVASTLIWPRWRKRRNVDVLSKASQLFHLRREWLEVEFLRQAAQNDRTTGVNWEECDFADEAVFATDRQTGELRVFVAVSLGMGASADEETLSDDCTLVSKLRAATAVFNFDGQNWKPAGHAILNLGPMEAVEHFHHALERVD